MKAAQAKQDAAQAEANINELRVKYEGNQVFRLGNWLGKPGHREIERNYRANHDPQQRRTDGGKQLDRWQGAQRGDSRAMRADWRW